MAIPFAKYSGCGNDFILIDNRHAALLPSANMIRRLCHRQQGIGADGIVLLECSHRPHTDYRMRIFNADGSEAEMCGNGLRCLAQHIRWIEKRHDPFFIETMHACMKVSFHHHAVTIALPPPTAFSVETIVINHTELLLHSLNTGVPHAVCFTDQQQESSLFALAPLIRKHPCFPQGTNVNVAILLPNHTLSVRTYERGVEGETLACGTGAVATALAASTAFHLSSPITVQTRSGDHLHINFSKQGSQFQQVTLTGPAMKIFEGQIEPLLSANEFKNVAKSS